MTSENHPPVDRFAWITRELSIVVTGSSLVVLAAATLQLSFGAYPLSPVAAWRTLLDPTVVLSSGAWNAFLFGGPVPAYETGILVTWTIRLPRVLVGVLVGMNLAVSGAILQAVTRNELASPFVLGVSSGAGLAVLLTVVVFTSLLPYLPLFAAVGGGVAFLLVYGIAWQGGTNPVRLVLAGVIVSSVFGSVQTGLFLLLEDVGVIQSVVAWTTGSLVGADWTQVRMILPWTVVAVGAALLGSRQLNVLTLGERTASSLGMSVEHARFGLSAIAVLAAAASVAAAGIDHSGPFWRRLGAVADRVVGRPVDRVTHPTAPLPGPARDRQTAGPLSARRRRVRGPRRGPAPIGRPSPVRRPRCRGPRPRRAARPTGRRRRRWSW